jgi:hypothetical protein
MSYGQVGKLEFRALCGNALESRTHVLAVTRPRIGGGALLHAMDPPGVGRFVNERVVADGRNALDSNLWRGAGWNYAGMGKP